MLPLSTLSAGTLFMHKLAWAASGLVVSLPLRAVYRRLIPRARAWLLVVVAATLSMLAAALWLGLYASLAPAEPPAWALVVRTYVGLAAILLVWSGAYHLAALWRAAAGERINLAETQSLLRDAQLRSLRQPLNPHFLFNALATVRALVNADPARARQAITELSELLRESLQSSGNDLVPLASELQTARRYLSLERMRFEDSMSCTFDCDGADMELPVPVYSIRSLVENAVKHSRRPAGERICITVEVASRADGGIDVKVTNPGTLSGSSSDTTAIGLANLRERLQRLFPGRHSLTLAEENGTVTALLTLLRASS